MGLDIVTNTMATSASNDIATNEANMQSSLQKLSSGYQINSPADDASGYVISQHLQAQIGGFQQAQANTQAGINVVQTADGALNEVSSILQRINTLAVQSANTSATDGTAQQAAQAEVTQALDSVANIAQTTVYGNNQLLVNGTNTTVNFTFQVGADDTSSSQVAFSVTALNLANLGLVNDSLDLPASNGISSVSAQGLAVNSTYDISVTGGAAQALGTAISASFANASGAQVTFSLQVNGGTAATVTFAASTTYNLSNIINVLTTGLGAVGDSTTSITVAASGTNGLSITDNSGSGSIVLAGAGLASFGLSAATYTGATATVSVTSGTYSGSAAVLATANLGSGTLDVSVNGTTFAVNLGGGPLSATSAALLGTANYGNYADLNAANFSITSSTAIQTITNAIQTVSAMGGTLGAAQNELTDISDNESVMVQNLQSSNAQIDDTDMASQMVMFTQDQTLVQAGVSMLAQANQIPQYVLKLLG